MCACAGAFRACRNAFFASTGALSGGIGAVEPQRCRFFRQLRCFERQRRGGGALTLPLFSPTPALCAAAPALWSPNVGALDGSPGAQSAGGGENNAMHSARTGAGPCFFVKPETAIQEPPRSPRRFAHPCRRGPWGGGPGHYRPRVASRCPLQAWAMASTWRGRVPPSGWSRSRSACSVCRSARPEGRPVRQRASAA